MADYSPKTGFTVAVRVAKLKPCAQSCRNSKIVLRKIRKGVAFGDALLVWRRSLALVSRAVVIDAYAAVRRHELHGRAATAKIGVDVFPADLSAIKRNVD
jgi:hypothetical protein